MAMMAVPRSPSRTTSPHIPNPTTPKGHRYDQKPPSRTLRVESRWAPARTRASLANSEGWNLTGPSLNQLDEPPSV